ncbi:hypothetical protein J8J17_22780, partial [Mycobacterium tuberculosis]|nr:hypothetical protein [Mycobacterium tuberculosis]
RCPTTPSTRWPASPRPANPVVHLCQVTFLLEDKQGFKFGGVDNVNFYHYPSYISLAKSSLPKLLTYLILNFT